MIKIENLLFYYGQDKSKARTILDHISLEIPNGKSVSILGHNGSGKSTLAKLLLGLLPIKDGKIFVNDVEVVKENFAEIRKICYLIFQNPDNQFVGTTVEDDIAFGLENHCVPHNEMQGLIEKYADSVGMKDYLKDEPTYLSGGQKQRVAIAGALVIKPKVLILDEATSMLDPKGKSDVLNLVSKMREEDKDLTVISITHDVEETLNSDEVIVLSHGKVSYQGSPKELFENKKLCNELELSVPFSYDIKHKLAEQGYKLESEDLDSMVEEICQLK